MGYDRINDDPENLITLCGQCHKRVHRQELEKMKPSSAKKKGRLLQQLVCEKISKFLGLPWGYEDELLIQPRIMGQKGVDVVLRGEAKKKFLFDVECKATENFYVYHDIEQAIKNTEAGRDWLLIHKKNRGKPIAIMDLDTFFKLMENKRK